MSRLAGRRVLSDDASIVEAGPVQVWPAASGVSLTPEAAQGLRLDPEHGASDPTRVTKTWYEAAPAPGPAPTQPLPLAGFVFLERKQAGASPRLAAIDGVEALKLVPPQLIRFDPSNRQTSGRLFERIGDVIAQSRCFRLDFPEDYAALPAVVAELERAWEPAAAA
jgi:hypothetical protein